MITLTKPIGTVTVDGVTEVRLPSNYRWVWLKNLSETDVYASASDDVEDGVDGTVCVSAGGSARLNDVGGRLYLSGAGKVQVIAQNYADCPFKSALKGGVSGAKIGFLALDGVFAEQFTGKIEED